MAEGYIHTYTADEQARLVDQAAVLERYVHPGMTFASGASVLEIGCGVGAQMAVVLRRHPAVRVTGIDLAGVQLATARRVLETPLRAGIATLVQGSGLALPFAAESFDAVYLVWVLEHVGAAGVPLLREAARVLRPGGRLWCTEVFNGGLRIAPESPALTAYWREFNALQRELGGDPDVGVRLADLALAAGLEVEALDDVSAQLDARVRGLAARREFLRSWRELLLSGARELESRGRVDPALVAGMLDAFARVASDPAGAFRYELRQLRATRRG
ncbi:MAG: class I SAM-dependent methyltransferase [Gammaproteobacteria bacterium]|jgi:SAM-dependent methyltransferase|nr:class I SAM-dependent methyltransferase [Gammaproteobacteria bacterium]